MIEIWKDVSGYEGFYEVSSFGRVRSLARVAGSGIGRGRCRPIPSTILKSWADKNGYLKIILCVGNKRFGTSLHRLVAIAFFGVDPERPMVNHKNGVTSDNRVENLEWVTNSENVQHALNELGRQYGRSSAPLVAYNEKETVTFVTMREAKRAGFSASAIFACVTGKRPRHKGFQWKRAA